MAKYVNFYGKVMFLHLSLNHSVHGGRGVYPSMHWGRQPSARADIPLGRHPQQTHPLARHPCPVYAGIHTPLPSACWETHPLAQCMLGYTPPCPVHAGIHTPLPSACWDTHPPPPPAATAVDGTHPTGMHSCSSDFFKNIFWEKSRLNLNINSVNIFKYQGQNLQSVISHSLSFRKENYNQLFLK